MTLFIVIPLVLGLVAFAIGTLVSARGAPSGSVENRRTALNELAGRRHATGSTPFTRGGAYQFQAHGQAFRITCSEFGKHGPQRYWIGTELPANDAGGAGYRAQGGGRTLGGRLARLPHVVCRRERKVDRLGKRLGLNREPQTGNQAFDDAFYIEADASSADVAKLLALDSLQSAARDAAAIDADLVLNAERHAVALRFAKSGGHVDAAALDRAVEGLAALTRDLPPLDDRTLRKPRSVVVGVIAMVVLTLGASGAMATALAMRPLGDHIVGLAAAVAGAALAVAVVVLWLFSRGRPRGLRRFAAGLAIAIATLPAVSTCALVVANRAGDATSRTVRSSFMEKWSSRSKNSTHYYARVAGWKGQPGPVDVPINGAVFEELRAGDELQLVLGNGNLGYPWLRSFRVIHP